MSVYNGAAYLHETVESILGQSFNDFEFIIIDDGSSDQTWEILQGYASKDRRIILAKNRHNIGLTRSLNRGLKMARGLYVARQDHDDLSLPGRLEKQVRFLDQSTSTVLVSSHYEVIDGRGNHVKNIALNIDPVFILWNLVFYNYLGGHSQVMFRREPVAALGGYSESFPYAQDYELWLRLLHLGDIAIIPEVLLKYRVHDRRLTMTNGSEQFDCVLKASGSRIEQLTGRQSRTERVRRLWTFWCLVHHTDLFQKGLSEFTVTQRDIRTIYSGFVTEICRKGNREQKQVSRIVRHAIGARCLSWFKIKFLQHKDWPAGLVMLVAIVYWMKFDLIPIAWKRWRLRIKEAFLSNYN
jgi:glycosyltransferase involved in cell wall biosynthesis